MHRPFCLASQMLPLARVIKCLPQRGKGDHLWWWMRCYIQVCTNNVSVG